MSQSTYVNQSAPGCGCGCITIPAAIFTFVLIAAGWAFLGVLFVVLVVVCALVALIGRLVAWAWTRHDPQP